MLGSRSATQSETDVSCLLNEFYFYSFIIKNSFD
jgi:hypothetical protein